MADLSWLPPTIVSAIGVLVSLAVYRLQWRSMHGKWDTEEVSACRFVLVNTGINHARSVRAEVANDAASETFELGDIHRNGRAGITTRSIGKWDRHPPLRITVRWDRRVVKDGEWFSEL